MERLLVVNFNFICDLNGLRKIEIKREKQSGEFKEADIKIRLLVNGHKLMTYNHNYRVY